MSKVQYSPYLQYLYIHLHFTLYIFITLDKSNYVQITIFIIFNFCLLKKILQRQPSWEHMGQIKVFPTYNKYYLTIFTIGRKIFKYDHFWNLPRKGKLLNFLHIFILFYIYLTFFLVIYYINNNRNNN